MTWQPKTDEVTSRMEEEVCMPPGGVRQVTSAA